MHVQARRVFRLGLTTALALALAYAMQMPLAFLAPMFALLLTATPGPPFAVRQVLGLLVVVSITLGTGLLLIPLLIHYPIAGLFVAAVALFSSFFLTVNLGKGLVGALLAVGTCMISAAGVFSYPLAASVIQALVLAIVIAVGSHWLVYPWFPEDGPAPQKPLADTRASVWIALRATLIVLPVYLVALTNPATYMPLIMKSVSLSQQSSLMAAREAGRELLGSTFVAGCLAVLFWGLLGIAPGLWVFFWLMLLFGVYFAAKLYRVFATRYPASFWMNAATTMLILLGPAVEDSANGKDVYAAFAARMGLFVVVTLYAWLAVWLLEYLRCRRLSARDGAPETQSC